MSLLEDVFLEDEAGEAQELERIIEGDEYDERPHTPNSDNDEEKEDEAEEDKRRVDPTQGKIKRVIKNPRFILNPARLTGPRGIHILPDHFRDFKFKGKGYEKEDLDVVLKKLEHWAYRLYPKFEFSDCLKKIEMLGKKRPVMVHLHKIRSDQFISEETVVQKDSSDDEVDPAPPEEDEFDKLLQQQIEIARATPAPGSIKKPTFNSPSVDRSLMMPKITSSPSISEEQKERMMRNRRLAEERRLAKHKNQNNSTDQISENPKQDVAIEKKDLIHVKKHNKSNVLDSSDDDDEMVIYQSITVDIHEGVPRNDKDNNTEAINGSKTNSKDMEVVDSRVIDKNNECDQINSEEIINTDKNIPPLATEPDNDKVEDMTEYSDNDAQVVRSNDTQSVDNGKTETDNDEANVSNKERNEETDESDNIDFHEDIVGENDSKRVENISSNKENVEMIEEIMDVDFSDEF